jgi:DNA-binding ferritin-like protein (Dps family)
MTPEEILKNPENQKFEVNIGVSLIRIIEITNRSQEYLREILKEQLVLKEMVKGKTELPEGFENKLFDIETRIWKASEVKYHKLLEEILDNN